MGDRRAAVRARDLLALEFEFLNLTAQAGGWAIADPSQPAYVVVHIPPQHVEEEAFFETAADDGGAPLALRMLFALGKVRELARSLGAAPSRLAFRVPAAGTVPGTLDALLAFLATCELSVVSTADPPAGASGMLALLWGWRERRASGDGRRGLVAPGPNETSIELPYRLILSPPASARFGHETTPRPVEDLAADELWHTRLDSPTVRAVWVREVGQRPLWSPTDAAAAPPKLANEPPFLTSLREFDRHAIVHLTADPALQTRPVDVTLLALSALGGWLDVHGKWEQVVKEINLEEWQHSATLGRDHFVKVVDVGYLFPFGHRAALVTITERKWQDGVPGRPAALRQRKFIVVRERDRSYAGLESPLGRTMPLKRVRIRTLVTPNLDLAADDDAFLPTVLGSAFPFSIVAEDVHGAVTEFATPLFFLSPANAQNASKIAMANASMAAGGHQRAALGGSPLALVPDRAGRAGETTFPVVSATWVGDPAGGEPGFHPRVSQAEIHVPAVEMVAGRGTATRFEYAEPFRLNGLGGAANPGEVYAKLLDTPPLDFATAADKAAGLLQPNLAITGLSRAIGPTGGDAGALATGKFDPSTFFSGLADAKLFGVFTLGQILEVMQGALDAPGSAPKLVTDTLSSPLATTWHWRPTLREFPEDDPVFVPQAGARMELTARVEAKGTAVNADLTATLEHVALHLLPGFHFLELPVPKIEFRVPPGGKPDLHMQLGDARFVGALSFVETLREYIPLDGFSDPPALEITPQGATSSFSLSLPDIAVGVFALQHVSLGGRLELPFTGPPLTTSFNFCTREAPFLLTVSMFGGGGFFLVKVDPNGLQRLEAALEFGASVSMNLGVASGGVHVMAGIYFAYETTKGVVLSGYLRVGGNVSVLGLISVSIELNLSLTYEEASGKAIGRATLTVEIELFLFSASVEIECERKFAGSEGDPSFGELMEPHEDPDDLAAPLIDPWAAYCEAYA